MRDPFEPVKRKLSSLRPKHGNKEHARSFPVTAFRAISAPQLSDFRITEYERAKRMLSITEYDHELSTRTRQVPCSHKPASSEWFASAVLLRIITPRGLVMVNTGWSMAVKRSRFADLRRAGDRCCSGLHCLSSRVRFGRLMSRRWSRRFIDCDVLLDRLWVLVHVGGIRIGWPRHAWCLRGCEKPCEMSGISTQIMPMPLMRLCEENYAPCARGPHRAVLSGRVTRDLCSMRCHCRDSNGSMIGLGAPWCDLRMERNSYSRAKRCFFVLRKLTIIVLTHHM